MMNNTIWEAVLLLLGQAKGQARAEQAGGEASLPGMGPYKESTDPCCAGRGGLSRTGLLEGGPVFQHHEVCSVLGSQGSGPPCRSGQLRRLGTAGPGVAYGTCLQL